MWSCILNLLSNSGFGVILIFFRRAKGEARLGVGVGGTSISCTFSGGVAGGEDVVCAKESSSISSPWAKADVNSLNSCKPVFRRVLLFNNKYVSDLNFAYIQRGKSVPHIWVPFVSLQRGVCVRWLPSCVNRSCSDRFCAPGCANIILLGRVYRCQNCVGFFGGKTLNEATRRIPINLRFQELQLLRRMKFILVYNVLENKCFVPFLQESVTSHPDVSFLGEWTTTKFLFLTLVVSFVVVLGDLLNVFPEFGTLLPLIFCFTKQCKGEDIRSSILYKDIYGAEFARTLGSLLKAAAGQT